MSVCPYTWYVRMSVPMVCMYVCMYVCTNSSPPTHTHTQIYSMAVEQLLGERPARLLIESIEDGRVGEASVEIAQERAREALIQVGR